MNMPMSDRVHPRDTTYGARLWLWLMGQPGHMHDSVWRGICARGQPRPEMSLLPSLGGSLNFVKGLAMAVPAESCWGIRKEVGGRGELGELRKSYYCLLNGKQTLKREQGRDQA